MNDIISISCGSQHTMFLHRNGTVSACGRNRYGQLGLGNTQDGDTPTLVPNFNDIVSISSGDGYTIFLHADGRVFTCGGNYQGELGLGDDQNRNIPTLIS